MWFMANENIQPIKDIIGETNAPVIQNLIDDDGSKIKDSNGAGTKTHNISLSPEIFLSDDNIVNTQESANMENEDNNLPNVQNDDDSKL